LIDEKLSPPVGVDEEGGVYDQSAAKQPKSGQASRKPSVLH